jgi:hypothetical protein
MMEFLVYIKEVTHVMLHLATRELSIGVSQIYWRAEQQWISRDPDDYRYVLHTITLPIPCYGACKVDKFNNFIRQYSRGFEKHYVVQCGDLSVRFCQVLC